MKYSDNKQSGTRDPHQTPVAAEHAIKPQPNPPAQPSKESRNRASTKRNAVKVEDYLMQVEKVHGFPKAWALRERLEQGLVSFDELTGR